MKTNDLYDFMKTATREMHEEYIRIQKRATEDPGTAGDQGEENWATLFREWLPSKFQIVTKGRILSHEGEASPQIDVIILKPEYPKKLIDKKLYLAGGVIAAFECKVTLKAQHIENTVKNSVKIRRLLTKRKGSPYKELTSPIIYGLLAHSHSWQSSGSNPLENIENKLIESDFQYVKHPREMLDVICVSDLAFWSASKATYFGPGYKPWNDELAKIYGNKGSSTSSYIQHSNKIENQISDFTPIGSLIASMYQKIGWEDINTRNLADYFRLVNLAGSGRGNMRMWPDISQVFSETTMKEILSGKLVNGSLWDEWSFAFI